ncbi:MAG TPA: isoprenyl transferase [Clostridia bacterium]|nr:isoprenyl transferase [Clostridia bacterium]
MWFSGPKKITQPVFDKSKQIPVHIAIFMDGNGRWAAKRGLPRSAGHREGGNNLKRIVKECNTLGIKYLTAYAFSTENWKRPKDEVDALMSLLLEFLKNADKDLSGQNIRIRVIGDIQALSQDIRREVARVLENTSKNTGLTLVIALNYGSRSEIANAAARIARDAKQGRIDPADIDEKLFSDYLYTAGIPDPDLVIRPSGEQRLSNFLLWQSSYAEFWYSNILWPDFTKTDLIGALGEFQRRNRRFGGL